MASARFGCCRRALAHGMKRSLPYYMRQHCWAAARWARPAGDGSNHHRYGEVKTRLTIGSMGGSSALSTVRRCETPGLKYGTNSRIVSVQVAAQHARAGNHPCCFRNCLADFRFCRRPAKDFKQRPRPGAVLPHSGNSILSKILRHLGEQPAGFSVLIRRLRGDLPQTISVLTMDRRD
jgi:hypothetical protein